MNTMDKAYNYGDAILADVWNEIVDNYDWHDFATREDMELALYDDLMMSDSVTGNESGDYTGDRELAREYVGQNLALLADAIEEFCVSYEKVGEKVSEDNWEYFDVLIRCYKLPEAIARAMDALELDGAWAN